VDVPAGLGVRGLDVWEALSGTDKVRNALALEAARLADRLDELDGIIQGKGVLNLMQFRLDLPSGDGEPFVVEVKFQSVLAEARQQQLAFANVLKALAAGGEASASRPTAMANVTPLAAVIGRGLKKG
jgi:hypothetical protein